MPYIIIVEKIGTLKSVNIKNVSEEELYKKAGYKSADGFKRHATWDTKQTNNTCNISVYGKTVGRANQENKYEFPPPIDKTLFFGSCILVATNDKGVVVDLTLKQWEAIYDTLYGGFEDLDNDDFEEDENDDESDAEITKTGYKKDGFVVDDDDDDDEDDDEEDDDYEDEDEDEIPKHKPKTKTKAKSVSGKRKYSKKEVIVPENDVTEMYFDCASELSEESYV